jgi:hypothetical protein
LYNGAIHRTPLKKGNAATPAVPVGMFGIIDVARLRLLERSLSVGVRLKSYVEGCGGLADIGGGY